MLETLILVAAAVLAQDADPETRFHEAYFAEVVEGKVADAAKVYVGLMEDDAVPATLRREARFRFAVCCVLLGRADEARARLAEILADPETPESLRARAVEYVKAVRGIGVGTELDRRMEQLVFDLGRTGTASGNNPLYRDFQIIGKPAVPFLKKLLGHPDLALREHAIRILMRMGEPGLVKLLDLSRAYNMFYYFDVKVYLTGRDEARRRLGARLKEDSGDLLLQHLNHLYAAGYVFSADFGRSLTHHREGLEGAALGILRRAGFGDLEWTFLARWIREGGETLGSLRCS